MLNSTTAWAACAASTPGSMVFCNQLVWMRRLTASMYQPYLDAKSPPPSDLIAMPGVLDDPGCVPAPVGTFIAPMLRPGTALSGLSCLGAKALCSFLGGGGFLLYFSSVLYSGTFLISG